MAISPTEQPQNLGTAPGATGRTFPDPTLTLIEFSDCLGLLLAARTEKDVDHRRLILKGVGYIRIEPKAWGAAAYPEVWLSQTAQGLFVASDPRNQKIFKHPSRRRYEVAFLSREMFDSAIKCIKDKKIAPVYELLVVALGSRPGFSVEAGCLLAPSDYAAEHSMPGGVQWVDAPPRTTP